MKLQKPPIGILPKKFSNLGTEERITEIFEAMDRYITAKVCPPITWLYELDELFKKVNAKEIEAAERKIAFRVIINEVVYFRDEAGVWKCNKVVVEDSEDLEFVFQQYLNEMFSFNSFQFARGCGKQAEWSEIQIQKKRYLHHNPDVWGGLPAPTRNHFHNKVRKFLVNKDGELMQELSAYPQASHDFYYQNLMYEQLRRGQISDVTNKLPPPSEEYYHNKLMKQLEIEESIIQDFGLEKLLLEEVSKVKSVVACDGPTLKEWFDK